MDIRYNILISILEYTPENKFVLLNSILKAWLPFELSSRDLSSMKSTVDKTPACILGCLVLFQEGLREDLTEPYHMFSFLKRLLKVLPKWL